MFGVSHKTIRRWIDYFKENFPSSPGWQKLRGRIDSLVTNHELPGGLIRYFILHSESEETGLVECLYFLASGLTDFSQSQFMMKEFVHAEVGEFLK